MEIIFENEFEITKEMYLSWSRHPMGASARARTKRWYITQTAGCVLALVLFGLAVYMKHILLMVLGGAFAVVFILRLFWLLERATKKQYDSIRAAQTTERWIRKTEFADDISVYDANSCTKFNYGELPRLTQDEEWFYLWRDENFVLRLRKGCFTCGSEENFEEFITRRIAQKTKSTQEDPNVKYMA